MSKDNINLIKLIGIKKIVLIFLLLLGTTLASVLTYYSDLNFWLICYSSVANSVHVAVLLLLNMVFIIDISSKMVKYIFFIRYDNYELFLQSILKKILKFISFVLLLDFTFILIASLIRSGFNFQIYHHYIYDIPIYLYLLLYFIREYVFVIIISIIAFYIYIIFGHKISLFFIVLISLSCLFRFNVEVIDTFLKMPLIITDYLKELSFSNIFMDVSCSIIYFMLLSMLLMLLEKNITKKRIFK